MSKEEEPLENVPETFINQAKPSASTLQALALLVATLAKLNHHQLACAQRVDLNTHRVGCPLGDRLTRDSLYYYENAALDPANDHSDPWKSTL
ncbi:hypothetical protein ACLOJK_005122 [Asimina triloba]